MNKGSVITPTALAIAVLARDAGATEYCVVPAGQDATYRGARSTAALPGNNNGDPRQRFSASSELAKLGDAADASIDRMNA